MKTFTSILAFIGLLTIASSSAIPQDDTVSSPPPFPFSFPTPQLLLTPSIQSVNTNANMATPCQQCSQIKKDCMNVRFNPKKPRNETE
jgi:hypothetical protein